MKFRSHKHALLSLFIASALGGVVVADAVAAGAASAERRGNKNKAAAPEAIFPDATRVEPGLKASSKIGPRLNKVFAAYNKDEFQDVLSLAAPILSDANANAYEKAVSAQLAAQASYSLDDVEGAKTYLTQAVEANGLDNNNHLQSLLMLAQLQLQDDEKDAAGLANLDRFFAESQSKRPDDLIFKGQTLYQAERFAEAVPVLKQAIAGAAEPKDSWYQLLMAALSGNEQSGEAVEIAKQLAEKNPSDKRVQMNLASMYMEADQYDQAAATIERLRAAGQLSEEREYRQLYGIYANMDNMEAKVIEVVNEGLAKGVLKEDHQAYLALAQSYYFTDKIEPAIEAWKKAAPLSPTGETYLNLARVLHAEGRVAEAREAARQAVAKGGLRKPEDAQKIINLK